MRTAGSAHVNWIVLSATLMLPHLHNITLLQSKGIEITNQSIDQTVQPGVQQTVQPGIQQTVEHGIEQTVEQDDPQYIFDMKTGHMIMASQPGGDVSGDVTGDVMMSTDGLMLQGNTSNEVWSRMVRPSLPGGGGESMCSDYLLYTVTASGHITRWSVFVTLLELRKLTACRIFKTEF